MNGPSNHLFRLVRSEKTTCNPSKPGHPEPHFGV